MTSARSPASRPTRRPTMFGTTARTNDEGWETVFVDGSSKPPAADDALFVFSVGGGNLEKNVSPNLVRALAIRRDRRSNDPRRGRARRRIHRARWRDACVVPTVNPDAITPHSEAFQAVVWHLLVSHPTLKTNPTKWKIHARQVRLVQRVRKCDRCECDRCDRWLFSSIVTA